MCACEADVNRPPDWSAPGNCLLQYQFLATEHLTEGCLFVCLFVFAFILLNAVLCQSVLPPGNFFYNGSVVLHLLVGTLGFNGMLLCCSLLLLFLVLL